AAQLEQAFGADPGPAGQAGAGGVPRGRGAEVGGVAGPPGTQPATILGGEGAAGVWRLHRPGWALKDRGPLLAAPADGRAACCALSAGHLMSSSVAGCIRSGSLDIQRSVGRSTDRSFEAPSGPG